MAAVQVSPNTPLGAGGTSDQLPLTKAEKKRIQNRINQLAYRRREAEKAACFEKSHTTVATKPIVHSKPITITVLPVQPHIAISRRQKPVSSKQCAGNARDANKKSNSTLTTSGDGRRQQSTSLTLKASIGDTGFFEGSSTPNPELSTISSTPSTIAPPPKQIYWEWAVQHPESLSEEEIQNLAPAYKPLSPEFRQSASPAFRFPLSPDHKIMLVQYNMYRAMKRNKDILSNWLAPCPLSGTVPNIPVGLIAPHLQPTALQQMIAHPSWVAIFPHPNVRDNFILRQGDICWDEIMTDLAGYLYPYHAKCSRDDHLHGRLEDYDDPSDIATTAAGHGMIVWGEPWDINNYEVTPSFMRKYRWLLKGCQDMIVASNRWRAMRGEPPIIETLD